MEPTHTTAFIIFHVTIIYWKGSFVTWNIV